MYDDFASVYDTLMDDFDYDEWSRHYLRLIRLATGELPRRAAECACGTGSLTVRLAQSGMAMTGVDLSAAMLRQAGTNGAGEITAYSVESSNVDLATEFSNMIVTQRAYSAATKIITTADEMLDELTRMT